MQETELGQEWFEQVKAEKKATRSKHVHFDREDFVRQVKAAIKKPDEQNDAGFVRELKRRRDFAIQVVNDYANFTDDQKLNLLLGLAVDLGSQDMSLLVRSLPTMLQAHLVVQVLSSALGFNPPTDLETYKQVKHGLVPLPEQFFLLVGSVPSGYSFVLQLRSDLFYCLKKFRDKIHEQEMHALSYLDKLMRDLFATQTGVHFKRIDLKPENREVLRVIVKNERVHAMRSWNDLAQRLAGPSRHVFGVFHSAIPLVIVETFLTSFMPTVIDDIIAPCPPDETPVEHPTHGVFYSISNMHVGLRGLNVASHLLFLTINHCSKLYPSIDTWVTLSPIPSFKTWMKQQLNLSLTSNWFTSGQLASIHQVFGIEATAAPKWFFDQLEMPSWIDNAIFAAIAHTVLVKLCTTYLLFERQNTKRIIDPVANFHLQNGAQVESVNFAADMSPNGLAQSFGVMVNYKYSMNIVDTTSISYKRESTVALSPMLLPIVWYTDNAFFRAIRRINNQDIHVLARQYIKGETILRRGQIPDAVYFLCFGSVHVETVPKCILAHGSTFGDIEVVLGEPVRFSVIARELCHVLFVRNKDMQRLLSLAPELKTSYIQCRL
ncbi:hypothetical protein AC1031_010617 [Aphanomyces cochlioides]|nr:hypothetical protein AC1031_010617 [Aphanomyces cochlioides]